MYKYTKKRWTSTAWRFSTDTTSLLTDECKLFIRGFCFKFLQVENYKLGIL